jgi:hypothetical protein
MRRRAVAATTAFALAVTGACHFSSLDAAASERLAVFDCHWQALADDYPLFGNQRLDWNELRRRYRGAVPFATRPHEFYHLLTGMLSELGDLHVSLAVPPERFVDRTAPTSLLDVPGFAVAPIEGRLHVVSWPLHATPVPPEGTPAGANYPELWRVQGFPVVLSLVDNLLLGPPRSDVELHLRWRGDTVTRHVLQRPPEGTPRRANVLGHLADDGRPAAPRQLAPYAWIELRDFNDAQRLAAADRALDEAAHADGLVIDLRRNLGGQWALGRQFVGRFLREPVEFVLVPSRTQREWFGLVTVERFVLSEWTPRPPTVTCPVVVLTSALTGSTAEHVARVLQRHAGAIVVGERTAGAEAAVENRTAADGSTLRFGSLRVVDRTGVGLQAEGVLPDVAVRLTVDDIERLGPAAAIDEYEQRLFAAVRRAFRRR